MKKFTIRYELEVTLTEKDLFPDGTEGLGEINADKVKKLIASSGGMENVIKDWNLAQDGELEVEEESDKGITATSPEFKKILENAPPWDGLIPSGWREKTVK